MPESGGSGRDDSSGASTCAREGRTQPSSTEASDDVNGSSSEGCTRRGVESTSNTNNSSSCCSSKTGTGKTGEALNDISSSNNSSTTASSSSDTGDTTSICSNNTGAECNSSRRKESNTAKNSRNGGAATPAKETAAAAVSPRSPSENREATSRTTTPDGRVIVNGSEDTTAAIATKATTPEAVTPTATAAAGSSAGRVTGKSVPLVSQKQLYALMRGLSISKRHASSAGPHTFWDTQPVTKLSSTQQDREDEGPIETKTVDDVRKEPYKLPEGFAWCECNVEDPQDLQEIYGLLSQHYVEDDDNLFRFNYSEDFLRWALTAPGARADWVVGVRVVSTKKLVGFITATPTRIRLYSHTNAMAEVNFLCVHKKLRSKRLAPVLIKEITRRVNLRNIWQAVYTAGVVLPTPVAECRYWHRSLNPKKLVDVGFSGLSERMTISRCVKLYKVKDTPTTPGLRKAQEKDVPTMHKLLSTYSKHFKLVCEFTEEEVRHWLLPRDGVVHVYVRTSNKGVVTDMTSFYELPSSVIGNTKYKEIKAAYSFYQVATTVPLEELVSDALCLAKQLGFDVFNALDVMENRSFVEDLKFGVGDGFLRYYVYNWRCPEMQPKDVGLVLL